MVLALALPEDFANRRLVVTMTFGVVLLSIVVQGLTTGPLLRALRLVGERSDRKPVRPTLVDPEHAHGSAAAPTEPRGAGGDGL
jgi:NhaP-type Na+/H+ or K+/H+ antiporter